MEQNPYLGRRTLRPSYVSIVLSRFLRNLKRTLYSNHGGRCSHSVFHTQRISSNSYGCHVSSPLCTYLVKFEWSFFHNQRFPDGIHHYACYTEEVSKTDMRTDFLFLYYLVFVPRGVIVKLTPPYLKSCLILTTTRTAFLYFSNLIFLATTIWNGNFLVMFSSK